MGKSKKKATSSSPTERASRRSRQIDLASPLEIAQIMNLEDQKVALAVGAQLKPVSRAIQLGAYALSQGGRLLYVGAGSSGRLGVLDAVECPPTFGVPPAWVQGILAGGRRALWRAVEGVEDDFSAGEKAIRQAKITAKDVVCGISASGKTPFVQGALQEAKKRRAKRFLLACNPSPGMAPLADVVIKPIVGPEIIAGSTRLKAGTATKMVLNMISTGVMIRLGKAFGNLMVDVKPASRKLTDRAERIIMSVLKCSHRRAKKLLYLSGSRTKVAIVMGARGCTVQQAEQLVERKRGFLREIL